MVVFVAGGTRDVAIERAGWRVDHDYVCAAWATRVAGTGASDDRGGRASEGIRLRRARASLRSKLVADRHETHSSEPGADRKRAVLDSRTGLSSNGSEPVLAWPWCFGTDALLGKPASGPSRTHFV